MMFHRLLLPFLLWVGISYAANEALIPLDHICDSGYCNFEFKVEGTYYFRKKNDVSRMEIQRFPNSFLDTSNIQLLQSVFIQYTEDLPEEPCRIFVNLNACIDLYIGSSNEPVHCCKQSETKRATSASETSATKNDVTKQSQQSEAKSATGTSQQAGQSFTTKMKSVIDVSNTEGMTSTLKGMTSTSSNTEGMTSTLEGMTSTSKGETARDAGKIIIIVVISASAFIISIFIAYCIYKFIAYCITKLRKQNRSSDVEMGVVSNPASDLGLNTIRPSDPAIYNPLFTNSDDSVETLFQFKPVSPLRPRQYKKQD